MELKEGMYVRTKWGYICELININDFREPSMKYGVEANYLRDVMFIGDEDISKASHNIIDLIEDEDIAIIEYYVSKYRQRITRMFECSLFKSKEDEFVIFENKHCDWWYDKNKKEWIQAKGYNPKIKSIVTKDMFESMEYKIC